jgi:hypothetical protein
MAPVHFLQQEFLVGGRDVEALARLVDEVRRPFSLLGEPRERTAQRFVRRHDGRERHGVIVRPQVRGSGHDESLRTAVAVDGARGSQGAIQHVLPARSFVVRARKSICKSNRFNCHGSHADDL